MNWVTPLAGLYLALAVVPPLVILYFLKLRRKPQAVSCTLLWKRSIEDLRANAPFQKLRRNLLLFLQLLALLLLALSVAQPQIHAGNQVRGKTVMLIDNSASMTAVDTAREPGGDATRLDAAKRRAKEKIESMYGGGLFGSTTGETMIIVFSDVAEVYCRFTDSKQQLLAAIDRIPPTHGESRIAEALKLARAYTTNVVDSMGEARPISDLPNLELYSDGRIVDLPDQVLRGETLNFHAIGAAKADNVAISTISVERPYDRLDAVEVFVSLLNFNTEPVTCDIQLSVNDVARGIEETTIAAAELHPTTGEFLPGRANVVFTPFEQPRDAVIEVANLRADDLPADNIVQVVVPPPNRLRVAIVAQDFSRSLILHALEGMKFERLEMLPPQRYEELAAQAQLDAFDVVVMDNYKPTAMPPGRYLTFGPTPPVDGLNEYGIGESQIILSGKDDHPILRFVTYDNLYISQFRLLQPAPDVQILLEGSRSPAAVMVSRGALQLVHCPFDTLESNFPFEQSFVTFLQNAVEHLGHAGSPISTQSLAPGQALTTRLPTTATDIQLLTPASNTPEPLSPLDPAQLAWGPLRLSGLHVLTWRTPDNEELHSRPFAVNLLSETEGRLDVDPVLVIGHDPIAGRRADEATYTPLWPWAIALCLTVMMLEWWVYHRKSFI